MFLNMTDWTVIRKLDKYISFYRWFLLVMLHKGIFKVVGLDLILYICDGSTIDIFPSHINQIMLL